MSGEITALEASVKKPRLPSVKKLIFAAAAAVIVIIGIMISIVTIKNAPLRPLKDYFAAVERADGERLTDSLPECLIVSLENSPMTEGYGSAAAYYEEEMLRDTLSELEEDLGSRIRIRFNVDERTPLSNEVLEEISAALALYGSTAEVEKAYDLNITYTIKGSSGSKTDSAEITVCKIDGKWSFAGIPYIIL